MSTISLTSATLPSGSLGHVFARIGKAWADRRHRLAFGGMSEREFQDIGWGQMDRHPHALGYVETPPEKRARAIALAAWHGRRAA